MNRTAFSLHQTADGSKTLYSEEMQESYHSLNGAVQESLHVFIEAGLKHCSGKNIQIFEIGFGTGLNALLTWGEAERSKLNIHYMAVEAFPLPMSTITVLGYDNMEPSLPEKAFYELHQADWNSPIALEENRFTLLKIEGDFLSLNLTDRFDLVYFDAFAPEKQPEMWQEQLFARLFENLNEKGILVTYCAKGEVRRRLQRCGFMVERIPGPPGKREMLRAFKPVSNIKTL
ncbi:MAG TPA: tRNA (5-methylaminomethyl-2-thiouridine)(34)-methyltransferase MnmD [Bacteroidales bacterium]|nr:tRNA (5-methylaminomethyl-2-thiouridine)(34)-methyltransferase MnmD [Bacteroidales bacterium]